MDDADWRHRSADAPRHAGLAGPTLAPGGDSLGLDFEDGNGHGGGERDRPEHHGRPGGDGAARRPESAAIARNSNVPRGLDDGRDSAFVAPCDISDRFAVKAVVNQIVDRLRRHRCPGLQRRHNVKNRSLESLDPTDWDRMIATNLTGSYNLVHAVLPSMRQKNGLIIQICSVSGLRASILGGIGYSASKFGQSALGICLGREEGPRGIRSSVIYPGEVNTPDPRRTPGPRRRRSTRGDPPARGRGRGRPLPGRAPSSAHVPELVIKPTVDDFC